MSSLKRSNIFISVPPCVCTCYVAMLSKALTFPATPLLVTLRYQPSQILCRASRARLWGVDDHIPNSEDTALLKYERSKREEEVKGRGQHSHKWDFGVTDSSGWYDRKSVGEFRSIVDVNLVVAMGPPGGGRNPVTQRCMRHFHYIAFPQLGHESQVSLNPKQQFTRLFLLHKHFLLLAVFRRLFSCRKSILHQPGSCWNRERALYYFRYIFGGSNKPAPLLDFNQSHKCNFSPFCDCRRHEQLFCH